MLLFFPDSFTDLSWLIKEQKCVSSLTRRPLRFPGVQIDAGCAVQCLFNSVCLCGGMENKVLVFLKCETTAESRKIEGF